MNRALPGVFDRLIQSRLRKFRVEKAGFPAPGSLLGLPSCLRSKRLHLPRPMPSQLPDCVPCTAPWQVAQWHCSSFQDPAQRQCNRSECTTALNCIRPTKQVAQPARLRRHARQSYFAHKRQNRSRETHIEICGSSFATLARPHWVNSIRFVAVAEFQSSLSMLPPAERPANCR